MLNKFIDNITISTRFLILIFIILMLLIAKSLYLIIFILILTLIISILNNQKLKEYLNLLKKCCVLIILILIIYLLIFNNIYNCLILFVKLLITFSLINSFICNLNFEKVHSAIYTYIKFVPLRRLKDKMIKFSYDVSICILFLKYLNDSKDEVKNRQTCYNRKKYSVKNYFLPILFLSIKKVEDYENNLKSRFYKLKLEKINLQSIVSLLVFVVLFVVAVIKEVIL